MKLIDKFNTFLTKVGVDKILHLLVAAIFTFAVLFAAYILSGAATDILVNTDFAIAGFLLVISFIKEQVDAKADYCDIAWAMAGWAVTSILFWLLILSANLIYHATI